MENRLYVNVAKIIKNTNKEKAELKNLLEEINDDRISGIQVNGVFLKGKLFDEIVEALAEKVPEALKGLEEKERVIYDLTQVEV